MAPEDLEAHDGDVTVNSARGKEAASRSDERRLVYHPLPGDDDAHRQKVLRRLERRRQWPAWMKKIIWFVVPGYGIMRMNDPNFEERAAAWRDQQRRNYDARYQ